MQIAIAPSSLPARQARDRSLRRKAARTEWPVALGVFLLLFGSIAGVRLMHTASDSPRAIQTTPPAAPGAGAD